MVKKIIFYALLFAIIGEIMLRIDEGFHMFEDTRVVKIPTDLKVTPEYKLLTGNKINLAGNNLRIMVLGDSYIAGGGINAEERFSQQLKTILNARNKRYDDIYVLDVSKPNSNTLDNNLTYFHFVDSFKPHIVILGYNLNDGEGYLEKHPAKDAGSASASTNSAKNTSFTRKIYNIYKKSKLLDFAFHKLHAEMKAFGIIFPNSEFDLILKSYYENRQNWQKSKILLKEMIDDAATRNTKFVVLKFAEINLLEHPSLFNRADNVLKDFFTSFPIVTYVSGADVFKNESSKEYILSKYDGHPNEKAHKKMAEAISSYIDVSSPGK